MTSKGGSFDVAPAMDVLHSVSLQKSLYLNKLLCGYHNECVMCSLSEYFRPNIALDSSLVSEI